MQKICYILFLVIVFTTGCQEQETLEQGIYSAGNLESIIQNNQRKGIVDLNTYQGISDLYGFGLLENANGVFLIWEGQIKRCQTQTGKQQCFQSWNAQATMFAYISQPNWTLVDLPEEVNSLPTLERFLLQNKKNWGIGHQEAFAIKMEGNFPVLEWFLPFDPPASDAYPDYRDSGFKGNMNGEEARHFGFFSDGHQGQFIHQGKLSNIFAYSTKGNITGQVDKVSIPKGMKLWVGK